MVVVTTQPTHHAQVPIDTFELRLLIARMHAGRLTTEQAGSLVGVSGQTWRNWESGYSVGARRPSMVAYIAKQLGVSEEWLRDGGPLGPEPGSGHGGQLDDPTGAYGLRRMPTPVTLLAA